MESAKEYIEELLKFMLYAIILIADLLLFMITADTFDGVPRYPLFKRLASAIYHSVVSGALCRTYDKVEFSSEDNFLKQKEEEWEKSILEKGTQIMYILKSVSHELHVQEPFFSLLKDGVKTIEGRCVGGIQMKPGFIILHNKSVVFEVKASHHYVSFSKMLEVEGFGKVLPGGFVSTCVQQLSYYIKLRERSLALIDSACFKVDWSNSIALFASARASVRLWSWILQERYKTKSYISTTCS
ncbi:hypothetical protein K2173_011886 [Erythroxylum novogranatense]|uniref:Uncharacterized protein n=1 Tax=Erythroxylum novogranatense TaxID=1862640 RepID=A0AAV8T1A1_9ROSI|nr:hypothetical protein K2173_011886 [Erythroxylum novogranatense]